MSRELGLTIERRRSRARYNKGNSKSNTIEIEDNLYPKVKEPYVPNYQREPNTASVERMLQTNADLKQELLDTCEEMGVKLEKSMIQKQHALKQDRE